MLDITKVLNRSWHILWKYRILWVFGFFLAMAAGGGSSGSGTNWTQNANRGTGQWDWNPKSWGPVLGQSGDSLVNLLITCGVILLLVILIWSVATTFLKYISETAAIRAVNDYEDTGIKASFQTIMEDRLEQDLLAPVPDQPAAQPAIPGHGHPAGACWACGCTLRSQAAVKPS